MPLSIRKKETSVTDTNTDSKTDAGDVIHYNLHFSISGDVALTGLLSFPTRRSSDLGVLATLAPGAFQDLVVSHTITQAEVDGHGPVINTGTADSNETGIAHV